MSVHQELLADKHPNQNPGCSLKRNCIKSMAGFKECPQNFQVTHKSFKMIGKNATKILKLKPFQTTVVHNCNNTILLRVNFVTELSTQFMRMKHILNRFTSLPSLGLT